MLGGRVRAEAKRARGECGVGRTGVGFGPEVREDEVFVSGDWRS